MAIIPRNNISIKQHLIPDSLTHSSGTISASINGVVFTASLSGLSANTLYFLYLRMNGGSLQLFFSSLVPSSYRSSFPEAVLIGAFYSNAASSVAFGSFMSIEGIPDSLNVWDININAALTGFGTPGGTVSMKGQRKGNLFLGTGFFTTGTVTATLATLQLFNMTIDANAVALSNVSGANGPIVGHYGNNATSNSGYLLTATSTDATKIYFAGHNASNAILQPSNGTSIAVSAAGFSFNFAVPILDWSTTPLKDL